VNLFIACMLYALGHGFSWFAMYAQFNWQWWEGKTVVPALVFATPGAICFILGTRFAFASMGNAWGPRFLGFGMSYLMFPMLTWLIMKESMLTAKTLVCVALSIAILAIQILWR